MQTLLEAIQVAEHDLPFTQRLRLPPTAFLLARSICEAVLPATKSVGILLMALNVNLPYKVF
jgi:hypothetical protein